MKQNKLQLNYKKSLFCYILAISLIPIFLLGMYSYKTYVNGLTTNVNVSTNATVNQVKGKVDNILSNIRKSYIEIADDNTVNWLLNSEIKYSDYTYLVEAGNSLSGPTYYSEYIDGFTFINYKTGWVYSNRGLFKYDKVINKEEVEEIFRLNESYLIRSFWISNITEDTSTLKRETVNLRNLCLVLKLPSIHKHPYAMLVVNISMSGLQKELRKDLGDNDITVIDMDGNLIFTTNKDVASSCINIQKNTSSQKKKLSEINSLKTEDGKQYSISVKDSNVMNWYYIISYDKGLISSSGEPILSYTFLLLGITGIIVLIALIFTHRLYMPILKLSQYVTRMLPNKDNDIMRNEFEYITQKFDKLSDNKALLESIIASQQPQMMELFQIRLIRGDIKQNQIDGYLEKINLYMGKYYLVFAINIKSQNGFEEYDEAKQDAIRIDVVENMPDTILAGLMMPPICYARTILCSITADDKAVLENNLLHEYEMLDEYIYGKYGFRISIGVSSIMEELTRFTYGYHECITALKNNNVLNQKNQEEHHEIMFYTDAMLSDTGYMYDKILERELREAIDLGEKEKAFSLIDDFINSLVEHNVVHNEACLSLHRILILCILVAYEAGLQMSKVFNQELADIFSQFNQMYDLNKIRAFLKYKIVDVIIVKLDEYRTSKSTEIMAEIKKLVDESNGDITLTECAEKLGYHPTYIWRIMKVEKNTTFSNYVGEYKLEEAKRLLMETDYSIADISAQLKYTNAQNFIRFFNKLEGVTPGKYRQMYKQNKMQE